MSIQPVNNGPLTATSVDASTSVAKSGAAAALRQNAPDGSSNSAVVSKEDAVGAARESAATTRERIEEAAERIKEFVQPINDSIQFSVDEDSGRIVVKVIDLQTKEILRQVPSEEALNIANALDRLQGLLIQNKA